MGFLSVFVLLFGGIVTAVKVCKECECCKNGTNKCIDNELKMNCQDGCIDGYYGPVCTHACIDNCLNCSDNTTCTKCREGFYGQRCNKCPDKCLTCSSSDNCQKCKDGFHNGRFHDKYGLYQYNCHFSCQPNCISCTSYNNCTKYACNEGFGKPGCTQCIDGRYGTNCDRKCSEKCVKCMSEMICAKCSPGHWGDTCISCPQHCSSCYSSIHCSSCDHGYYGNVCDSKCPNNCHNETCDNENGTCLSCVDGFYGKYCNTTCPRNCKSCDFHTGYCQACFDGFYGDKCQNPCLSGCKICQKSNGHCTECFAGFLKEYNGVCAKTNGCHENCRTCNNQLQICTSCIDGKFGQLIGSKYPHCKLNCPVGCLNKACNVQTGHCINGCIAGYWGLYCTTLCPLQCREGKCFQDNGTCIQGPYCVCDSQGKCKSIKNGVSSEIGQELCRPCPYNCTAQEDTVVSTTSYIVMICASAGALVIVLAFARVTILLKRRNSRVETEETGETRNMDGKKDALSKIDETDVGYTDTGNPKAKTVQECVPTYKRGTISSCGSSNYETATYEKVKDYENICVLDYKRRSFDDSTKDIVQESVLINDCYTTSEKDNYEEMMVYVNAEEMDYKKLASVTDRRDYVK